MRQRLLTWLHPRSLRWKIAALVAVACCAVAAVVGMRVHQATYERSLSQYELRAVEALDEAAAAYRRTGRVEPGAEVDTGMPEGLRRRAQAAHGEVFAYDDSESRPQMWAARPVDGHVLAMSVDMTTDMLIRSALDRNMVKGTLVALAVVIPVSALGAEWLSRRLRRASETARRIADGDLDARIGARPQTGDEVADISGAVDSMAGALQERLRSEQQFTADVAHELRTPLMGLVTSAELLPEGEATGYVQDRVRVLRSLVEDLLEISRLDAGAERADLTPVPVGEVVRESVHRTGAGAVVAERGETVAATDPRRLDRIVTNLVTNALRHGEPPVEVTVDASADGPVITVRDHGPGFPDELLAEGPQRFRTGAWERGGGHGLGLTIARGQAQVIGARLEFAGAPDGGAVAVLRLPG